MPYVQGAASPPRASRRAGLGHTFGPQRGEVDLRAGTCSRGFGLSYVGESRGGGSFRNGHIE